MKPLLTMLLFSAVLAGTGLAAQPADRPNLVFIIADDCTYRDISCYGGQAHTPHLNQLATEGIRMTRCFQAAPMCSPTRHNIYTGLYPVSSGAYPNHTFVKEGTESIAHYLEPLGYRIALSGKKHINPKTAFPFEYSGRRNNPDMEAIDQLMAESKEAGTPFCLFACSNEPHSPWNKGDASQYPLDDLELPPNWVDTPTTRKHYADYLAEITYFDSQVGEVLDRLQKHDLSDDTLVMVVSEQGSGFPFAKWTLYDNGIRSAMLVRWPGKIQAGTVSDAMVEYVDVCPTFLEAAGAERPSVLQGASMLPVLLGEADAHKQYVYAIQTTKGIHHWKDPYPIRSIRDSRYKLIWNLAPENTFRNACVRKETFQSWQQASEEGDQKAQRLTHLYQHRPELELYDVSEDPYEMNNLAEVPEHAAVVEKLHGKLRDWMARQGDEGLATEVAAKQHQWRHVRKQKN